MPQVGSWGSTHGLQEWEAAQGLIYKEGCLLVNNTTRKGFWEEPAGRGRMGASLGKARIGTRAPPLESRFQLRLFQGTVWGILMVLAKEESICRHQSHKSPCFWWGCLFLFPFFSPSRVHNFWGNGSLGRRCQRGLVLSSRHGWNSQIGPYLHILMNLNWKGRLNWKRRKGVEVRGRKEEKVKYTGI